MFSSGLENRIPHVSHVETGEKIAPTSNLTQDDE